MAAAISKEQADYLFHHLFLPSKLPGGDDSSPSNEARLVDVVHLSLRRFLVETSEENVPIVRACISMVDGLRRATDSRGYLREAGVLELLRQLNQHEPVALFHIRAQNAGVLIRLTSTSFVFETFELSPTGDSVFATKGRLIRHFPAHAIEVLPDDFHNADFQSVLAKALMKMSHQPAQEMIQKVRKAKQEHDEERETVDPRVVTELLTSILRGVGEEVKVMGVSKNTREEVMWSQSKLPWRRSPVWLLLRVGLQLTMTRLGINHEGIYKQFMVFLMAQVLDFANRQVTASDVLHTMTTKISRRLCKLENPQDGQWLRTIQRIVSTTSKSLAARWKRICERSERPLELDALSKLDMREGINFSLPQMEEFLSSIPQREKEIEWPNFAPPSHVFDSNQFPDVHLAGGQEYLPFNLAMVESWVAAHLNEWLVNHIKQESSCQKLKTLIETYHSAAAGWYSTRPEGASRMLLAIGELWVAADRAAIHAIPMLKDYEPEVPTEVWQVLLLSSKADMERLHRVETYLLGRQRVAASKNRPSVFRSYGESFSFQVKYFSTSSSHQELKILIEREASQQREEKRREFRRLKERYDSLMQQHANTECEQLPVVEFGMTFLQHFSNLCSRCALLRQANDLQVHVHEWPLPMDLRDAQTTVFELAVPPTFAAWRDITLYLIDNVLGCEPREKNRPESSYPLRTYQPLSSFFSSAPNHRIHLLSSTKPNAVTHRQGKSVGHSTEADVCVNNGLQYHYFDESRLRFLSEFSPCRGLSSLCTFKLPSRAKALKRFLARHWECPSGETPNRVIASQSDCPDYMPLGEYKALAALPYGYQIQWMSILTQLAMPTVDFNKTETATFLLQMSLQAGPYSASRSMRETHARLSDPFFGRQMLRQLTDCVSRVQENWESHTALCSFTMLATRLLSLASQELCNPVLNLLGCCRQISYQWLTRLVEKAQGTVDSVQRQEFLEIALDISLICVDSFNVDDKFMLEILSDPQQASLLVEASIIIRNNSAMEKRAAHPLREVMFDRWRYTMHRARSVLVQEVTLRGNACLDIAIKRRWPAFKSTSSWTLAPGTCYWFETTSEHLQVHLNSLTGELLVNGLPLSRLPSDYEQHSDYRRLFGPLILDVTPSALPGMRFCTTTTFQDHVIHFGMQDAPYGEDLLVRMEKNGSFLDLIPPRTLTGLLPDDLVGGYAHWYHSDSGVVEFRPLDDPWSVDADNWQFKRHLGSWELGRRGRKFLLAPSSLFAERIAAILSPLEARLRLHLLYDVETGTLEVQVPGLQLEFLLRVGESAIRSRQFRAMQIDADQSVGTLVGFQSKLILRNENDSQTRMLIIPEGEICYQRWSGDSIDERHVRVSVKHGTASRVQAYRIDNLLYRLVANDKIESKLHLAYLHALTSFCFPDPFLKRKGTEEALRILQSASVRTPGCLSPVAYERLGLIAGLAPRRFFYPKHMRVMQNVEWSTTVSFSTQDDRFYKITQEIRNRAREIGFLYPQAEIPQSTPIRTSMDLVERAILHASRQHVSGFGAEDFTTEFDTRYNSRDSKQSDRGSRAYEMAFRIHHNHRGLFRPVASGLALHLYRLLECDLTLSEKVSPLKNKVEYDSRLLQSPQEFLSSYWCQIHYAFKANQNWLNKSELMVWIASMSYSAQHDEQATQALLMLALSPSVSAAPLAPGDLFQLRQGYNFQANRIESCANQAPIPFGQCPEARLQPLNGESAKKTSKRRQQQYQSKKNRAASSFRDSLARQWSSNAPSQPQRPGGTDIETYINVSSAMAAVFPIWTKWYQNQRFKAYLETFVRGLSEVPVEIVATSPAKARPRLEQAPSSQGFISIDHLFAQDAPSRCTEGAPIFNGFLQPTTASAETSEKLTQVVDFLDSNARLDYERRYLRELRHSLSSLRDYAGNELDARRVKMHAHLFQEHLRRCESRANSIYQSMLEAVRTSLKGVSADSPASIQSVLSDTGFLPRLSPALFLEQLRSSPWLRLPGSWRSAIREYGLAITALQQAKRFIRFQHDHVDLLRELENTGHQGWDPHEHPEWLLLECESEIMIREVQEQIAQQMIEPPDDENAVMQLNMGEGKSSVIVPIVAIALGDGSRLVRVIVAKPQAKQMHQMLVSKLAGLLDRPVYQIPFSRDIRMDNGRAEVIHRLLTRCMEEGGVLMVQPEHLLSFQLMELECRLSSQPRTADKMMQTREFFDSGSRDVVDESDENFSVKFELIYTLGQQRPIEHSPDRWKVIQEVLGYVRDFSFEANRRFPQSMEFDDRHEARFPRIRILRPDAEEAILNRVASFICETGMVGFPIARQPPQTREAVRRYITQTELLPEDIAAVEQSSFWAETTISHILLLRGLLSGGILAFALGQKRWRVNYGTDPNREKKTKLAVPFRAKDNPTPRSEFSHPDVVIVLTCLSYYYSGLDDEALFSALSLLIRSDNAALEYQAWVQTAPTLPHEFGHLEGINLKDRIQCISQVFPHLRYSKAAIDYYLCRMVFAKESKEFPHKLSASGWDLGKKKGNPTTGFSGTNDSRYVLPLDIKQLDLPEQKHTNALVLEYLLRPENGIALMPAEMRGATFDSQSLLQLVKVMSYNTRVILDVGAQVIDLSNLEFGRTWLKCYEDEHTQAVIFFNDRDEIMVLDKSGKVEELQTSPFAEQLDQCLVFLDEAHTRGTDLKLPADYQAAVTLGANLTKDRLVQACMRMRKLGKGQTVVFCIPREIEQKIRQLRGKELSTAHSINVSDVLCWVITETCQDLRRAVPLWLTQGLRFYQQQAFWDALSGCEERLVHAQKFMEAEAQSLDIRYRPGRAHSAVSTLLRGVEPHVSGRFQRHCQEFGLRELRTSSLQEEQERELSPETEEERQVEKPPPAEARIHQVHPSVRNLVRTGIFNAADKSAFKIAFEALGDTSAAKHFDVREFPKSIWVTNDFAATVKGVFGPNNGSDSFQRPVQWILACETKPDTKLVVISPFEAQQLLPEIEDSRFVTLHLYAPRINLGYRSLDHLNLYSLPRGAAFDTPSRHLTTYLNLFAGQLYFSSFDDYVRMCDSLGLAWSAADESVALGPDGFIPPHSKGNFINKSGFSKSPVRFFKVLMAKIRQECELIEKTHMGKVLEGVRLLEDDFSENR